MWPSCRPADIEVSDSTKVRQRRRRALNRLPGAGLPAFAHAADARTPAWTVWGLKIDNRYVGESSFVPSIGQSTRSDFRNTPW